MNTFTAKIKKLFEPQDLTKGTPWKVILTFTIPIFISYLFQQIYTIADTAIVGQFAKPGFAGVNNTGPLTFLVLQFAFGCTAGFSVCTSNAIGQKDYAKLRKSFAISIWLSLVISIVLTALAIGLTKPLLQTIGLHDSIEDKETYTYALIYIYIIFGGLIGQVFYNLICGVLRAVGDSLTPLLFLVLSSVLNIVLDLIFVIYFPTMEWKVAGAAIATIISQILSAILCFIYTFKKYDYLRLTKADFKFDKAFTLEHLKNGLPLGFQFSILAIGLITMQGAIIKFDVGLTLADGSFARYAQEGYGAANKFNTFLMCPMNALGTAMLSYCSQNRGANENKRLIVGMKHAFYIGLIMELIVTILALLLCIDGAFLYIFMREGIYPETIKYAITYQIIDVCLYFFLLSLFLLRNSIQGCGKVLLPFLGGVAELVARILLSLYGPLLVSAVSGQSQTSYAAYILVCLSDPLAWIFALFFLVPGYFMYFTKRNEKYLPPLKLESVIE